MSTKKILSALGMLMILILLLGCNQENQVTTPGDKSFQKSGFGQGGETLYEISPEEIAGLIHMRLEEKLARDVYTTFGVQYNYKAFLNIKLSEQNHMNAVKRMLDKYSIPDPIVSDEIGVFPDAAFQDLYNNFIAQGSSSLYEALVVGKTIEEIDIADLEAQLLIVDNPDIIRVYTNLKAGSENHLAAFIKCISGLPSSTQVVD
ncbi:MAG: DUF2202 domain-containing protein [Ignavibacteriales bacterium]|nr:MAG: DUF2202 domain-containing protein [Ignavibacteriales bacterium]